MNIEIVQKNGKTSVFCDGKKVTNPVLKLLYVYGNSMLLVCVLLLMIFIGFNFFWIFSWIIALLAVSGCILLAVSLTLRFLGKGGFQIKRAGGQTGVSLFGNVKQNEKRDNATF